MSRKKDKLKDSLEGLFRPTASEKPGPVEVEEPIAEEQSQNVQPESKQQSGQKEADGEDRKPSDLPKGKQSPLTQEALEQALGEKLVKDPPASRKGPSSSSRSNDPGKKSPTKPAAGKKRKFSQAEPHPQPESRPDGQRGHEEAPSKSIEFETGERVVVFSLGEEAFGVDIYSIRTLVKPQEIFPVPHMPDYLIGLTNLRGEIVPVIDLRKRLGFAEKEYTEETRYVVAEKHDEPICLVVDDVTGIEYFAPGFLEEPSEVISSIDTTYLYAIGKSDQQLVLLLDLDQVLGERILLGKTQG
jgi:purine-binding chemotaxis protein CheW